MSQKSTSSSPDLSGWQPPSTRLKRADGIWISTNQTPISYPEAANDAYFQIEDSSYWFRHRMACIAALTERLPPAGTFFDIGGGNGYITRALQQRGVESVLVEPGAGALNARKRGCQRIIQSTLDDAGFAPFSLPAAGAFDVLEHLEDHLAFLRNLHACLRPGGRFYCTVPALSALWSADDVYAGHYRRYDRTSLRAILQSAGFEVEFISYFFAWLVPPVFALRALPSLLGLKDRKRIGTLESVRAEHTLPAMLGAVVSRSEEWELARLRAGRPIGLGTSLLCVARVGGNRLA